MFLAGTLYEFQHRKIVGDLRNNKKEIYVLTNSTHGNIISIGIPIQPLGKFCHFSIIIITSILSSIRHTTIMFSSAVFSIAPDKSQIQTALKNDKIKHLLFRTLSSLCPLKFAISQKTSFQND